MDPPFRLTDIQQDCQCGILSVQGDICGGFVFATFVVDGLSFIDTQNLSLDAGIAVQAMIDSGLSAQQDTVTCEDIGAPTLGDIPNARFGVFNGSNELVGIWYLGTIASTETANKYEARALPYFPDMSDANSASFCCDVAEYLLSNSHQATCNGNSVTITFAALRYVIRLDPGDAIDDRSQAQHQEILDRANLSVTLSDTPIPDTDRTEVKIELA